MSSKSEGATESNGQKAKQQKPLAANSDAATNPTSSSANYGYFGAVSLLVLLVALTVYRLEPVKEWLLGARCEDQHEDCGLWSEQGECSQNPEYMSRICTKSCKLCQVAEVSRSSGDAHQQVSSQKGEEDNLVDDEQDDMADDAEEDYEGYEENDDGQATGVPRFMNEVEVDEDCVDKDADCAGWAKSGECEANPGWMLDNCRLSCNSCGVDFCRDADPDCAEFAERGECDKNPDWMLENCKRACGVCGEVGAARRLAQEEDDCANNHKDCVFWAGEGECEANPTYMLENCRKACNVCGSKETATDDGTEVDCADKHPTKDCRERAKEGECTRNPGWMIVMCAKSCNSCHLLLQKKRCQPEVFNDTSYVYKNALESAGELTGIFEKVRKDYPQTEVLLAPPKGPWVVKLPHFITDLERETLLNLTLPHVKRSTDQGKFNAEGIQEQIVSQGRTSSNAWCMSECAGNPVVQGLLSRIASMLTVPTKNFESFQVLQYKKDQKYDVHHDSSDEDLHDMAGPRILTFFMYLSDVEEGGETFFNKLDLKVKPQTGMAILWPSVLDEDPTKIDWRTTHAALPVIAGTKYAANLWVHMRDFETPNVWGCTGAFD